jgi:hypothetical protein
MQRKVAEGGDVEERDFVCASAEVLGTQLHWLAEVAHVALSLLLAYIVLIALGDHQVSIVVRAHVQARDHAAREPRCEAWRQTPSGGAARMVSACTVRRARSMRIG